MKKFLIIIPFFYCLFFLTSCRQSTPGRNESSTEAIQEPIDSTDCQELIKSNILIYRNSDTFALECKNDLYIAADKKDLVKLTIGNVRFPHDWKMAIFFYYDTVTYINQFVSVIFTFADNTTFKLKNQNDRKGCLSVLFFGDKNNLPEAEIQEDLKIIRSRKLRSIQFGSNKGPVTYNFSKAQSINFLHYFNCLAEAK